MVSPVFPWITPAAEPSTWVSKLDLHSPCAQGVHLICFSQAGHAPGIAAPPPEPLPCPHLQLALLELLGSRGRLSGAIVPFGTQYLFSRGPGASPPGGVLAPHPIDLLQVDSRLGTLCEDVRGTRIVEKSLLVAEVHGCTTRIRTGNVVRYGCFLSLNYTIRS